MRSINGRVVTALLLAAVLGMPAIAFAADATLYELTENMKITRGKPRRVATSQLMGFARVGTPLCPQGIVDAVSPGAKRCAINATGSDNISLATGLGDFLGAFTVVVQGDNPFDGPELVVMSGSFRGRMDFSPALVLGLPFGTVAGTMTPEGGKAKPGSFPFTGVFRLPFAGNISTLIPGVGNVPLRIALCRATPEPNPNAAFYGGYDLAYLDNVEAVGTSTSRCIDIQPSEISLGEATVRFDILF
jgi:hypothetical protein